MSIKKIGIGVTTTDPDKYLSHMIKWDGLILFNTDQISIAKDKNKLIKQLYILGCDYIVIFDDDTFPIKDGWAEFFIEAAEKNCVNHFVLVNDKEFGKGTRFSEDLTTYGGCAGCMLFLTRKVIETVGYMNTAYGKYGWEHFAYSYRIYKAGLAPAIGTVVNGWEEFIYAYDLQEEDEVSTEFVKTEWQTVAEKDLRSKQNLPIFEAEMASPKIYYPYEEPPKPKKERTRKLQVLYMYLYEADPIFYYRLAVLKYINSPDIEFTRRSYSGEITWATLQQYDVLILERPSGVHDLQMIKLAKQVGVKVIVDFDDDCLNVDIMNPMYQQFNQSKPIVMESLVLADEVWVTTKTLKNSFSLYNRNIVVIPNGHNDSLFPIEQKREFNPNTKKAVWRGGQSHEADVYSSAKELIKIINGNKKWGFHFLGDRFMYLQLNCGANYNAVSPMPLMQYLTTIRDANPNIVFHPLQDNLFNRSKSNISFLESSYAGAAFVGNKNLPEFDKHFIFSFDNFGEVLKMDMESLKIANQLSWEYIVENLLLSDINKIRVERLLNI